MLTITINGVDRTANIVYSSIRYRDNLTSEENTCDFVFEGPYVDRPQESQEIIIMDGATKEFAGTIIRPDEDEPIMDRLRWTVSAVDYQRQADKHLVVESYENKTAKEIITDINAKYMTGFTVVGVETGPTFVKIQFNYIYPH